MRQETNAQSYTIDENKLQETLEVYALSHDQGVHALPMVRITRQTRYYPSRMAQVGLALLRNELKPTEAGSVFFETVGEDCGHDYYRFLKAPMPFSQAARQMRAWLIHQGLLPESVRRLKERLDRFGNVYGRPDEVLAGFSPARPENVDDADVLIYAGPFVLKYASQWLTRWLSLFDRIGLRAQCVDDGTSLGTEAWKTGLFDIARYQAQKYRQRLAQFPTAPLICVNPWDAVMIQRGWPELGLSLHRPVETIYDRLQKLTEQGMLRVQTDDAAIAFCTPLWLPQISPPTQDGWRTLLQSLEGGGFSLVERTFRFQPEKPESGPTVHLLPEWPFGPETARGPMTDEMSQRLFTAWVAHLDAVKARIVVTADPYTYYNLSMHDRSWTLRDVSELFRPDLAR